jgi:hypothetical protein
MGLRTEGATRLELLPHPAHRRDTEAKELRNFIRALALFVEVDDSFADGQRDGAHGSTLPLNPPFVKLHVLWKRSNGHVGRQVEDFLKALTPAPRRALRQAMKNLADNQDDVKLLEGNLSGLLRLRVGKFRVIFEVRIWACPERMDTGYTI